LLQTSILGRLSGPLCDAVTGQGGGKGMLAALDRKNLFLVSLDDRRRWYRYHHLFADVLQARLQDEQPGQVPDLHRRASEWYGQNGELSEAIGHALAARDFERAADLVELAILAMRRTRQEAKLRGWLEVLPHEVVQVRRVLSVYFAGALLLGSLMYRSRLVPRLIPAIGLIGAPLLITAVFAALFGGTDQGSSWVALAALPVAAWELSLGVWLVVKGFRPSPITAGMAAAATPPARQDVAV
jgi:uncharacterized protein DUF4386